MVGAALEEPPGVVGVVNGEVACETELELDDITLAVPKLCPKPYTWPFLGAPDAATQMTYIPAAAGRGAEVVGPASGGGVEKISSHYSLPSHLKKSHVVLEPYLQVFQIWKRLHFLQFWIRKLPTNGETGVPILEEDIARSDSECEE
ncbi:hypothetical protein Taro_035791 [Colocasia esculenta]|uniref:Uncharacterized protein n=1 Tax=Colocasia esculenta TaxID=4460 RepID=A0A843W4V0_COLES|nr:hypothetical protein [Colocasia esculenta]